MRVTTIAGAVMVCGCSQIRRRSWYGFDPYSKRGLFRNPPCAARQMLRQGGRWAERRAVAGAADPDRAGCEGEPFRRRELEAVPAVAKAGGCEIGAVAGHHGLPQQLAAGIDVEAHRHRWRG